MSSPPAHDTKELVRQAIDIVDLVGSYIDLRRQGRYFVGTCPWHDDTRPSLQVNQDRQSWKCWVCNDGGDIFSFFMKREGVQFREALEMLASRAGIELQKSPHAHAPAGSPGDKNTLFQACAWAEQQFHEFLLKSAEAEAARRYLEERGITPATVEKFHVGYAPDQWQWLVERATSRFSPEVLAACGLAGKSEKSGRPYDLFRGRVIFSIRDSQSRPIAFGGRILPQIAAAADQQRPPAKYYNSPETRLFTKSQQLYALDLARPVISQSRHVVVVEGYTDVALLHQHGIENVVAVLGTALGQSHVKLLQRLADRVTLLLDGDAAGQRRTNEILDLFIAAQVDLRVLTLPEGLDPADYVLQNGPAALQEKIDSAADALDHSIAHETAGIDLMNDTHRANQAFERLLGRLARAPRLSSQTTAARSLREKQFVARLARTFRVPEEELRVRLSELRQKASAPKPRYRGPEEEEGEPADLFLPQLPTELAPVETELLELLLLHPEFIELAASEVGLEDLQSAPAREIFATYLNLEAAGRSVEFGSVLTAIEEPRLKSLLVSLDESAQEKETFSEQAAALRMEDLIYGIRRRHENQHLKQLTSDLEDRRFSDDEELSALQQIFDPHRRK